ncbi:hypothetical protein DFQ45_1074 [Thiopseudomonas denitrificans]|uniref:Uncharacterized protein n=1 Tax=Thiopseudomonas denitrificans TaxID=1501432 RepID=A0A4R6TXJ3_9GAMM|nr:hypothetical protein DFQ45_1074 [Thiopseudomonas denitrificans]
MQPVHSLAAYGDGLFEQRMLREAWTARTGQRFIVGIHSDEAIYRYLMDNVIISITRPSSWVAKPWPAAI